MRRLGWICMTLAGAVAAQEGTGPLRLAPTPLEVPRQIGPLVANPQPHQYPEPGLGVSYQYQMPGAALTVYVYDADLKDLADGPDSIPVCREYEIAKQGVVQAYQQTKLVSEQMARLLPPAESPLMREAVFEFQREQRQTLSYVWITGVARHFIKLRFSADARLRDELPEARRAILAAFGEAIRPHLAAADPQAAKPDKSLNLLLGAFGEEGEGILYTLFLSALAEQSPGLVPVCGGEVVPTYEAERALYRGLFLDGELGKEYRLSQQIARIDAAGFLDEFVWVDLHRESWGQQVPDNLELREYAAWKRKNLKRFKAPRFGTVTIDHPRPLPLEPASP